MQRGAQAANGGGGYALGSNGWGASNLRAGMGPNYGAAAEGMQGMPVGAMGMATTAASDLGTAKNPIVTMQVCAAVEGSPGHAVVRCVACILHEARCWSCLLLWLRRYRQGGFAFLKKKIRFSIWIITTCPQQLRLW